MQRSDHTFQSAGVPCAAWLYRPEDSAGGPVPCVILASGFSGTRDQRLDAFAERFAQAGLAALVFDYRHFGDSGGQPRQLLDIGRQLAETKIEPAAEEPARPPPVRQAEVSPARSTKNKRAQADQ